MKNEMVLTESKTMREEYIDKDYILDKVKALVLLPDNLNVTTEMVAEYYEVDKELVKYHIKQNKDELVGDGLKVLKNKELKEFKQSLEVGESNYLTLEIKNSPSLTLIPRRAILRLGMLIQKSEVAKQIRTYLLNVEENTKVEDRLIAITQETNSVVIELKNELNILELTNNKIVTENEELKHITYNLINKVDELLEQPLFKIHENASREYDKLMIDFEDAMESIGIINNCKNQYTFFNKEFENWTGVNFGDKKINKKQYWLNFYGIDNIKQFIFGIKQTIIVKSFNGNWISSAGIYSNKIEWNKILNDFNHKCAYCGNDEMLMADHMIPQSKDNSTDKVYNLVPCCQKCNSEKGAMSFKDWLEVKKVSKERIDKIKIHWYKYKI